MLGMRGLFAIKPIDDAHMHLNYFVTDCKSNGGRLELSQDDIALRLFPLSLTGEATVWLSELLYNLITTWRDFERRSSRNTSLIQEVTIER